MIDKLELNSKAQELRIKLGEDSNSPIDIFKIVTQIDKLTIVQYPLGLNISGICIKDSEIKLIAVNSQMSYGRQRYSLAHELYHLYYDNDKAFNVCAKQFDVKPENEKCADIFASFFLAPYTSLKTKLAEMCPDKKISLEHIIMLEQFYGISHQALLWRLKSENYIKDSDVRKYLSGIIQMAISLGYDTKLYIPTESENQRRTYGHYIRQIEQLKDSHLVSDGKIEELLLDAYRDDIVYGTDINTGEEVD